MNFPKITLPTINREKLNERAIIYLKGFAIFFKEIIAPSVVIGTISFKCHLEGWNAMFFMIASITLYWSVMWKLEAAAKARTEAKFTVSPRIFIPEHFDIEEVAEIVARNAHGATACGIHGPNDPDETRKKMLQQFVNQFVSDFETDFVLDSGEIVDHPENLWSVLPNLYRSAKRLQLPG